MKNKKFFLIFLVFLIVFTSFFSLSLSSSAYNFPSLTNGYFSTYYTNYDNVPHSSVTSYYMDLVFEDVLPGTSGGISNNPTSVVIIETIDGVTYMNSFAGEFAFSGTNIDDGVYLAVMLYEVVSDNGAYLEIDNSDISSIVGWGYGVAEMFGNTASFDVYVTNNWQNSFKLVDGNDSTYESTLCALLYDLDIPLNSNGGVDSCPTLQEQINSFNGTWSEFQSLFENNLNLSYGYDNELNIEYNRGHYEGYSKGSSNSLVSGFFSDMLNAPINILNGIVIYQISDGGTPLDTTDDINITVWGVLVTVVIISLFLILLKIFAGG